MPKFKKVLFSIENFSSELYSTGVRRDRAHANAALYGDARAQVMTNK